MKKTMRSLALAGGLALVAGATAAVAAGRGPEVHHMTIKQPDGGVIEVTYTGAIAPKVTFNQGAPIAFERDPAFEMLQQISADMDRHMREMQQMFSASFAAMPAMPRLDSAALSNMPAGSSSSFTSISFGNGVSCMRSVEMTSDGKNKPKVVEKTSGNCNGKADTLLPVAPKNGSSPQVTDISYR